MVFKGANIKRDFKILVQCKKDSKEFIDNNIVNNFSGYKQFRNIINDLEFID